MKRIELKEILQQNIAESARYYRQHPSLYRDVMLWEDYLAIVEANRRNGIHSAKERARIAILDKWAIGENTFYNIHKFLRDLCEDVT